MESNLKRKEKERKINFILLMCPPREVNQHFLKTDIEGLGFSFKFDSKIFTSFLDMINIEYSVKSLVAFGQIAFNISVGEKNGYFYMIANLLPAGQSKSEISIRSPPYRSKRKDFLREKINRRILRQFVSKL